MQFKAVFALLLCLPCCLVHAEPSIQVMLKKQHYVSHEYLDGNKLNSENGQLPVFSFLGEYTQPAWRYYVAFHSSSGQLNYQGRSQLGRRVETITDIDWQVIESGAQYKIINKYAKLWLGATVEAEHYQRDIQGLGAISGLNESYRSRFVYLTSAIELPASLIGEFALKANYAKAIDAELSIDFLNRFDAASTSLNQVTKSQITLEWALPILTNSDWSFLVNYTYQLRRINESQPEALYRNGIEQGTFFQPEQQLRMNAYGFSVKYQFN